MESRVSQKSENGVAILVAEGYLNEGGGDEIAQYCLRLMEEGQRQFLLDFTAAHDVNSMGISTLFGVVERAREVGAELALTGLSAGLMKTFEVMGLTQFATTYGTRDEALEAMALSRPTGTA